MPYIDVFGINTYYEVRGNGDPVVLLHGALAGADSWSLQQPALEAAGFQIWAPERRGHGHTADTLDPFTYADMTRQTIAFLDSAIGRPAHIIGWSDGAVIAARIAIARPDLVDRLAFIGQYFDISGQVADGFVARLLSLRDEPPSILRGSYDEVSPDGPEHFPAVFAKTVDMLSDPPAIGSDELAKISAPTLVLQGDRDEVRLEHSAMVSAVIPNARLAVLPGTHALLMESPNLVNGLLIGFLRGGPQELDMTALITARPDSSGLGLGTRTTGTAVQGGPGFQMGAAAHPDGSGRRTVKAESNNM